MTMLIVSPLFVPSWLVLLSAAIGLAGLGVFLCYFEDGELWKRCKRVVIAAMLAAFLSTAHVQAVYFTQYYPCTAENWAWLLDNLYEWMAWTVWNGAYGCF